MKPRRSRLAAFLQAALLVLLALVVALGGGAASAWLLAGRASALPAERGWHPLPNRAALNANPYLRDPAGDRLALEGRPSQTTFFVATRSEDGALLRGDCAYTLSGHLPPARIWTVSVLDETFAPIGGDVGGLTSANAVWNADGSITVSASAQPAPGNWLPLDKAEGGLLLLVGLYDAPALGNTPSASSPRLAVERSSCQGDRP